MSDQPSVGIVGAGATGGYLAACLSAAGIAVTLVARGATLRAIQRHGIRVEGPGARRLTGKPAAIVGEGEPVDPVDVIIFCVKSYDTQGAARLIDPLLHGSSVILCTQNGVDNETVLGERFGASRILPGVLYIGADRLEAAIIRCTSMPRLVVGPSETSAAIVAMCRRADIECVVDDAILASKWQKFLFNCSLNPLTALTRMRLGALLAVPEGRELFEGLLDETLSVATAHQAPLRDSARAEVLRTAERMNISSSMAEDLAAGRRIELEAFSGLVRKLGFKYCKPTPKTDVIYQLLAVLDNQRAEAQPAQ